MKTFTILFFVCLSSLTFSQSFLGYEFPHRVKTGSTPTQLYPVGYLDVVVYCAGIDNNFNGIQDEGDEPPSLWTLPAMILAVQNGLYIKSAYKLTDLEFKTPMLPVRNYWDETTRRLYVINKSSIDSVDFKIEDSYISKTITGKIIDSIENVSAVSAHLDKMFISIRPTMDTGYVLVYDIPTKTMIDTIPAGSGVQMTQYTEDGEALIILSEGHFGKDDGKIQIALLQNKDSIKLKEFPVGGTPNHFYFSKDRLKLYVTCNSSHEIKIIDLVTDSIYTNKLSMAEYDGPRESMMFDNAGVDGTLFTTAYDSKIYAFNEHGIFLFDVDVYGKAESCLATGTDFIIATPFQTGTYTPDTAVTVYSRATSVDDKEHLKFNIYPNPATSSFSVDLGNDYIINDIEVFNSLGIKVADYPNAEQKKNYEFSLGSGFYIVRINHNKGITTIPLSVVH